MFNERYPGLQRIGSDAFDTEVNPSSHALGGKPLALATDPEIVSEIEKHLTILSWGMEDYQDYHATQVALLQIEQAWRAATNAAVVLPDAELSYQNLWHKDTRTWNPSKPVWAVRTSVQMRADGQYLELGCGAIGLATSAAHALRIAEYWNRKGWAVEAVAVPCLFSDSESQIVIGE